MTMQMLKDIAKLRAENKRLRDALKEIADNGYLGVKGQDFCHPEGCESPGIAQKALRRGQRGV